jgi:hypothetical protein
MDTDPDQRKKQDPDTNVKIQELWKLKMELLRHGIKVKIRELWRFKMEPL